MLQASHSHSLGPASDTTKTAKRTCKNRQMKLTVTVSVSTTELFGLSQILVTL